MMCKRIYSEPLAADVVEVGVSTVRAARIIPVLLAFILSCLVLPLPSASGLSPGQTDTSEFTLETSPYYGMNSEYVYATGGGSSVAIDPWRLITASHYSFGVGATLTVGTDTFEVISTAIPPIDPGEDYIPDVKVIKLQNLTRPGIPLPGWYDLYEGSLSKDQLGILVGTGFTGTAETRYYRYDDGTPRLNRWGTNRIEASPTQYDYDDINRSTMAFRMEFTRSDTDYEVGLAMHDSGAGIFVLDDGEWELAGLGLYIISYYAGGYDKNYAASIPDYADWILDQIPVVVLGDANRDGIVSAADYEAVRMYYGNVGGEGLLGDANGDGLVTASDYGCIQSHFGSPEIPNDTPEPATMGLILLGGLGLLRRKKK